MPILAGLISLIGFIFLFFIALIGALFLVLRGGVKAASYETRFRNAQQKYHNPETAKMIARGEIWTGQTAAQLVDSKGEPESIYSMELGDTVYLYPNNLRVVLRDGIVVNW